jgi:hypothetical protein
MLYETLSHYTPTPDPSTFALLGVGAVSLLGSGSRRRASVITSVMANTTGLAATRGSSRSRKEILWDFDGNAVTSSAELVLRNMGNVVCMAINETGDIDGPSRETAARPFLSVARLGAALLLVSGLHGKQEGSGYRAPLFAENGKLTAQHAVELTRCRSPPKRNMPGTG